MSESIPKIEGDFLPDQIYIKDRMVACRDTCNKLGLYSFTAALGIGFLAYSATHVYVGFCAPAGLMGFVQSLVIMDSTFCQLLMGIVTHSQSLYGAMMVALLLSIMGGVNKGVSALTGSPEAAIPQTMNVRFRQQ